jgi:hypothetical protein
MWKVAFGFDKGNVGSVPTGGKKIKDHHRAIAIKLFFDPEPFGTFVHDDLEKLDDIVKNHINKCVRDLHLYQMFDLFPSLKTLYGKHRKMMSETGQGLIDDGREDDITPGSDIANMWGTRYSTFIYSIFSDV